MKCKECHGKGFCLIAPKCYGKGRYDPGLFKDWRECKHCSGSGIKKCGVCNGKGYHS